VVLDAWNFVRTGGPPLSAELVELIQQMTRETRPVAANMKRDPLQRAPRCARGAGLRAP
jgi:hypothetical protein